MQDNREKVVEVVEKLENNSGKGLELIEKFLEISRFDTQLSDQDLEKINIPLLIHDLMVDLDLNGKLDLRFMRNDFSTILAKDIGMRSLFQNLLTNAFKYRRIEEGLIVELHFISEGNNRIIRFKDNGIGIDLKANEKKMFKPFVRIADTTEQEGTGVGLFLVKKVVFGAQRSD